MARKESRFTPRISDSSTRVNGIRPKLTPRNGLWSTSSCDRTLHCKSSVFVSLLYSLISLDSYLQPGALHFVITLLGTIVAGFHFFSMATMRRSLTSFVHCAFLNANITNVDHLPLVTCHSQSIISCVLRYRAEQLRSKPPSHFTKVPDLT